MILNSDPNGNTGASLKNIWLNVPSVTLSSNHETPPALLFPRACVLKGTGRGQGAIRLLKEPPVLSSFLALDPTFGEKEEEIMDPSLLMAFS